MLGGSSWCLCPGVFLGCRSDIPWLTRGVGAPAASWGAWMVSISIFLDPSALLGCVHYPEDSWVAFAHLMMFCTRNFILEWFGLEGILKLIHFQP